MDNLLYNLSVACEAATGQGVRGGGGLWKKKNSKEWKRGGEMESELGMKEKTEEGGGKVWKLADRNGYAQTESQGPGPDLSLIWVSKIPRPSLRHPPVLKKKKKSPSIPLPFSAFQWVIPHSCLQTELLFIWLFFLFSSNKKSCTYIP